MTRVLALLLLACCYLPTSAAVAATTEPIPLRLLRTVHMGTPQGLDLTTIQTYAKDSGTPYAGYVLAQAALQVLNQPPTWPAWPPARVLRRTIELLQPDQHSVLAMPGMPDGYGIDDLAFTLVFAMVISGQAEQAIEVLQDYMGSKSEYTRFVALQALRQIGSERATELLKQAVESGHDANYVHNLLADLYFPFAAELYKRLSLIPSQSRGRQELLRFARERCSERATLAVYFLGFLGQGAEHGAELTLLRDLTRAPCLYTRIFAAKALALRSPETADFWLGLYHDARDAWLRDLIVRNLFIRFEKRFLAPALALLADEPSQYVQWDLMHGNIELREGARFRDYWELWQPHTLQYRLTFPQGWQRTTMAREDVEQLLGWLESGKRPQDMVVRNHMLYGLARNVGTDHTRRFLRAFNAIPEKAEHWWILWPLDAPQALPLLRYWLTLDSPRQQKEMLANKIASLEGAIANGSRTSSLQTCCHPTRACLLTWIEAQAAIRTDTLITNAAQAGAWLEDKETKDFVVRFTDALERVAEVRRPDRGPEHWEHLYGCWTRIGEAVTGGTH